MARSPQSHGDSGARHLTRTTPRPPCAGQTSKWYSDQVADQDEAKADCTTCHLVARCLFAALRRNERHGVWGATTAAERGQILAALRRLVEERC